MPITKKEFEKGRIRSTLEEEIITFLFERKDRAFTSQEVMEGLSYHAEFNTPEISKMSTFTIADFTTFLHHLVENGKIMVKIVRGRTYIMAKLESSVRCPKCGGEIAKPKKTWKMTARPDKKGARLQLQIGLFQCPKHGFFRKALEKRKILPAATYEEKVKRRATKSTKKAKKAKKTKKRTTEKKPKSGAWGLI
ncbi:MAG TPA: hypothetical protein VMW14_03210 [Candidatus Paceibacterota bacterium]|nr:hypothetical protein [Candidatus Paceibacterota bacterium]